MRPTASAALLALSLTAAPSAAAAAPFSTWSFFVTNLAADFGLVPFQISAPLVEDLVPVDWFTFGSGSFDLVSGSLTDLTVDGLGTHYSYGPGTVTIALSGSDENGTPVAGTLTAPTLPFSFTVCEGCDSLFGGGLSDDFGIDFGPGLLDLAFAEALHVSPDVDIEFIALGLEDIDGGPGSVSRTGFDHRGRTDLDISVTEVPEPSLLLLGAISATALALRRRRSRSA
jgi:hypothetical protein